MTKSSGEGVRKISKGQAGTTRRNGGREQGALDVLRLIWAMDHGLQVCSLRMARDLGVTGPQRLALRLLFAENISSPGALATRLVLHKSTVTGIVSRLEERGLLVRRTDAGDGRRQRLEVTAAGRKLARPHSGTIEAAVERALASARPGEVKQARAFLERLAAELVDGGPTAARARGRRARG